MDKEQEIIYKIEAVLKKYRESWGYGKKIDFRNFAAHEILAELEDAGYRLIEPEKLTVMSDEEIDEMRLQTIIDNKADKTWWDMCAAYEKMYGEDAALSVEQILIDITNNTGLKVSQAQRTHLLKQLGVEE